MGSRYSKTLAVLVVGAIALLAVRAVHQNLTGDEASTYTRWVEPVPAAYWTPDTNNHVLNSLLMSLSTDVFGGSPLPIRLPALLAGCLFCLLAGVLFAGVFGTSSRAPLGFVLLVLNPFLFDYLFAARGYSMALAGELVIFLLVWRHLASRAPFEEPGVSRCLALGSLAAGLASTAQYAFIPVLAVALVSFYLLVCLRFVAMQRKADLKRFLSWLVPTLAPCGLLVAVICGDNLARFPPGILTWGTYSFREFLGSISERLFEPPNPNLVPPHLRGALSWIAEHGVTVTLVLVGLTALLTVLERKGLWLRPAELLAAASDSEKTLVFSCYCLVVTVLTVLAFVAALHVRSLRLPVGRTALGLMVPAGLLVACLPLTTPVSRLGRLRMAGSAFVLLVIALPALGALRISHFTEWDYDADVREATWVAGTYMREHHLSTIGTTWHYRSTATYYKKLLGFDFITLAEDATDELWSGREIYFVPPQHEGFIDQQGLTVLCEGVTSHMRVAVRVVSDGHQPTADPPPYCAIGLLAPTRQP